MLWILLAAAICAVDLGIKHYIDTHKEENCYEPAVDLRQHRPEWNEERAEAPACETFSLYTIPVGFRVSQQIFIGKGEVFYELDGVGDKCFFAGTAEDNRCIIF